MLVQDEVKVKGYCRVSTDEQAEDGYSIRAQKERISEYANSKGWLMSDDDFYIDDGFSGKDFNRPNIQRLLNDIQYDTPDAIIVNRTDRLSRDLGDTVNLTKLLKKNGIALISLTEDMKVDTATDRLKVNVTAVFNQYEREKKAEDVKMGMERATKEGHRQGGPTPIGYNVINKKLVVNEKEAEIVKDIFDKYINKWGVRTIAADLNKRGILSKKGSKWGQRAIIYIIQNPIYIGKLRWNYRTSDGQRTFNEIIIDSDHEPIISEETFELAQATTQRRKEMAPRQSTHTHPFAGMIECSTCGKKMHVRIGTKYWPHTHYICPTKQCNPQIKHEDFEEKFLEKIKWMANEEFWIDELDRNINIKDSKSEIEKLENELKSIKEKKDKWFNAFENDVITMSDLKERMKTIEGRDKEIQEKIKDLKIKISPVNYIPKKELLVILEDFDTLWNEATELEKKNIVLTLFEKIIYYPDKSIKIIPR